MTPLGFGALFAFLGLGLGLLQFVSLYGNLRLYLEPRARQRAIFAHGLRLGVVAFSWFALVHFGGAQGLFASLMGFLLARVLVTALVLRPA